MLVAGVAVLQGDQQLLVLGHADREELRLPAAGEHPVVGDAGGERA